MLFKLFQSPEKGLWVIFFLCSLLFSETLQWAHIILILRNSKPIKLIGIFNKEIIVDLYKVLFKGYPIWAKTGNEMFNNVFIYSLFVDLQHARHCVSTGDEMVSLTHTIPILTKFTLLWGDKNKNKNLISDTKEVYRIQGECIWYWEEDLTWESGMMDYQATVKTNNVLINVMNILSWSSKWEIQNNMYNLAPLLCIFKKHICTEKKTGKIY